MKPENPNSWAIRTFMGKPTKEKTCISQETLDKISKYETGKGMGSVYCQMKSEFEKACYDYEGAWIYDVTDEFHEEAKEHFYCVALPAADFFFEEYNPNEMQFDQGMVKKVWETPKSKRHFLAVYTPYGIQRIDGYFCKRIQNMETIEEGLYIEKQLIHCPHLHIKIKENLALNLNNYMAALVKE